MDNNLRGNYLLKLNCITDLTKLKKYDLGDIFCIINLDNKIFTFTQQTLQVAQRLDYFLISGLSQDRVKSCDLISSFLSDHSPIIIKIYGQNKYLKKDQIIGNLIIPCLKMYSFVQA